MLGRLRCRGGPPRALRRELTSGIKQDTVLLYYEYSALPRTPEAQRLIPGAGWPAEELVWTAQRDFQWSRASMLIFIPPKCAGEERIATLYPGR